MHPLLKHSGRKWNKGFAYEATCVSAHGLATIICPLGPCVSVGAVHADAVVTVKTPAAVGIYALAESEKKRSE